MSARASLAALLTVAGTLLMSGLLALILAQGAQGERLEIYSVQPDPRMCPSPTCGGGWAALVNRATTPCPDGEERDRCYFASVDFSAMGLSDNDLAAYQSSLYAGRALAAGWIEPTTYPGLGVLGTLHVQAGWQVVSDAPVSETIYRVRDNGIRCIAAPCFSYDAQDVNLSETTAISNVDLSRVQATPEQRAAATEALFGESLLVAGTIQPQPGAGPAGDGRVLIASQFYLPVSAPPSRTW
jgi:hypothetical protein